MLLKASSALSVPSEAAVAFSPSTSPLTSSVRLSPWRTRDGQGMVAMAASDAGSRALTGVVFEPFEEVKKELSLVPSAPNQSLARQKYTDNCEAAINEQIKYGPFFSLFSSRCRVRLFLLCLLAPLLLPFLWCFYFFFDKSIKVEIWEDPFQPLKNLSSLVLSWFFLISGFNFRHDVQDLFRCLTRLRWICSVEYNVSYAYHALFAYFDRDNIALKGLAK